MKRLLGLLFLVIVGCQIADAAIMLPTFIRMRINRQDSIEAVQGNVSKQLVVAKRYAKHGNSTNARKFLEMALEAGNDTAKCYLAEMDYYSSDTEKQIESFNTLISMEAEGSTLPYYMLGVVYYYGEIVPRDYAKALQYFNKVVPDDEYYWLARYFLSKCYRFGYGVNKDLEKANSLLKESAECSTKVSFGDEKGHPSSILNILNILNIE